MKTYKRVIIPEKTRKLIDSIKCDLCGKIIVTALYDAESVEVSHTFGQRYPEGSDTTTHLFDICGKCFDDKLAPWLQSQGAEMTIEEYWD